MVTMQDVAREAGVSKATVSYVLSGSPLITDKTASRVRAAMDRLGYSVNHAARSLSTARTDTIAIVSPAQHGDVFSLSLGAYLYALSSAAHDLGYDSLLLTGGETDGAALSAAFDAHKFDGAVVLDVRSEDPRLDVLRRSDLPVVLLGVPGDPKGLDYVDTDFESAAGRLVDLLADAGHREVLLVGWPQKTYDVGMNYALRFRDAAQIEAERRGVQLRMVYSDSDLLGSDAAVRQALLAFPDATAMIIHNDAALVSAQQVLGEVGVVVPDDVSVVTVVPDQMAIGMRIPFTSMSIDLRRVAYETVAALDRRVRDRSVGPQRMLVEPVFKDAGSVAAPGEERS